MVESIKRYGLLPKSEQHERALHIRALVLNFLYYEPYTTVGVIQELTGYKSVQGATNLLRKLEKQGLVKRHRLTDLAARQLSLWGITGAGCSAIYDPDTSHYQRTRGFDTSKIFLTTLNHLVQTQLVKCRMLNSQRDITIEYINLNTWDKKQPDILATIVNKEGASATVAYEIELTIKSIKRYEQIVINYRKFLREEMCDYIIWATKNETDKEKLTEIFTEMGSEGSHHFRTIDELNL